MGRPPKKLYTERHYKAIMQYRGENMAAVDIALKLKIPKADIYIIMKRFAPPSEPGDENAPKRPGFQPGNKGGGRKKGSTSKVQMQRQEKLDRTAKSLLRSFTEAEIDEMSPKDMLLLCMRTYFKIGDVDRAAKVAADVAPYVDPKLAATALVSEDGLRALKTTDIRKLLAYTRGEQDGTIVDVGDGTEAEGTGEQN